MAATKNLFYQFLGVDSNTLLCYAKYVKSLLFLKLILLTTLGILIPLALSLFFISDPVISITIGLLTVFIISAIIFFFLKPLKDLIKSTEELGSGKFNQRVNIKSGDEFEKVGNSFNAMAEKLSHAFQNLDNERGMALIEKVKLEEVLSSIIDGIIALDFNKNVIFSNKAAQEMTGYTQAQLQGQSIDKLIHLFIDKEEIVSNSYCQANFNKSANLIGKMGKQTRINIITTRAEENSQTNVNCILILHDLFKEEELERMKLDFVSMASHELRTPLTSIVGYLSVFSSENKDKLAKEESELIDKALIAAKQLLILVQNLLSVNKIERVQMSVSPEPADYLPILSKAVEDLKSLSAQKNIVLNLIPPQTSLPKILIDPIKIVEVITNLVANAINYTNPGGKVEVTVQVSRAEVTTTISDTGIGIPQEAIPHLFNKFFRISNSTQQASKGTGLGLYIAKSIIEKLDGKIWVESEFGKGSKFSFTLPVVNQSAASVDSNSFISSEIQSGALNY